MQIIFSKILRILLKNTYFKFFWKQFIDYKENREIKKKIRKRIKRTNVKQNLDLSRFRKLNIIFITVDCLRFGNLSSNGYFRKTTPFLDKFEISCRAFSTSPFTFPSVPSILTGLYPHKHNALIYGKVKNLDVIKKFQNVKDNVISLPELFSFLGYKIYFTSPISLASPLFKSRLPNRLFPSSNDCLSLFRDLGKWIIKQKKPFFAYLQLGDLHAPLKPPKNFVNYFGEVDQLENIETWDYQKYNKQNGKNFEKYKKNKILLYDNTLRYVDASIKKLFNFLKSNNLLENTLIVVTSDHGEEFWEYSDLEYQNFYDPRGIYGIGHGHNVFNNIIKIPILISGPKIPRLKNENLNFSAVDIMPTILELLNIKHKIIMDGRSIFNPQKNRFLLTEGIAYGYEKKALIFNNFKFIYSKNDDIKWVFDLDKDPLEKNPIRDKRLTRLFKKKLKDVYTQSEKDRIKKSFKKGIF